MNRNIYAILFLCLFHQFSIAQNISLEGNIWLDYNMNNLYEGEDGVNDVKVYLINVDSSEIFDSTFTVGATFNFPSSNITIIPPGTYYLQIAAEEFTLGGNLQNITSCLGAVDPNNEVDSDDNGLDTIPIQTTHFSLDSGLVQHIDFCLSAPCNEANPLALPSCDQISEADIFCDIAILGTFCNQMPFGDSGGNQPNPLCPDGGAPENMSWFAFVAYDGDYSLTISPSVCSGSDTGTEGIQMGLYTDCTFSEEVFCNSGCSINPVTFDSSLLEPGQKYYLFIDGCGGSVCSYSIGIEGNPIPPSLEVDELCILDEGTTICEDSEFKTDDDIVFQVDDQANTLDYTWTITTLLGGPFEGDAIQYTEDNELELIFSSEGIYTICLTNVSSGCSQFGWNGQACRTVTIENAVSVKEFEENDIKIIPNPAFDYLKIDGNFSLSESTFFIYSIDGERVKTGDFDSTAKIEINDLPEGLYVITLVNNIGETIALERFVKNN